MQRSAKIVDPLGVQAQAAALAGCTDSGLLRLVSAIKKISAAEPVRAIVHRVGQFAQKRLSRHVEDRMHRVEPQGVDVKFIDPLQRVGDKIAAHFIAFVAVEIERRSPRSLVAVGEIGAEIAEVISLGTQMVVDHVQHYGQAARVTGIDQSLEPGCSAIRMLRGERINAVIAPIALSRKLRHRHDFDGRDAQLDQCIEPPDRRVERSRGVNVPTWSS